MDERASVCPTCNRDVAIPPSLLSERAELLDKRERMRARLEEAKSRLAARRRFSVRRT